MRFRVKQDLEGVGDVLKGDGDGFGFVSRDGDLKVSDTVFLHEGDVFGGIVLGDEGA